MPKTLILSDEDDMMTVTDFSSTEGQQCLIEVGPRADAIMLNKDKAKKLRDWLSRLIDAPTPAARTTR